MLKNLVADTDQKLALFLAVLLSIFCSLTIFFSASIFPLYEPDTSGYVNFNATRTSLYPIFIVITKFIYDSDLSIIVAQITIYLGSYAFLIWSLQRCFRNLVVTGLLGLGLALNVYLQAYHTVILTESLTFSFCNILSALFLNYRQTKNRFLFAFTTGLVIGLLVGLRPAMASHVFAGCIIIAILNRQSIKALTKASATFLVSVFAMVSIEVTLFHAFHEKRESIASLTLIGKAAILTTYENFVLPDLPPEKVRWLIALDNTFEPFENWLNEENNFFVKTNLRSNFEVFGQYRAVSLIEERTSLRRLSDKDFGHMGFETIKSNPILYLQRSLQNLVGLWLVHDLAFWFLVMGEKLPVFEDNSLQSSLPGSAQTRSKSTLFVAESRDVFATLSIFVFPSFIVLGAASFILSVRSCLYAIVQLANEKKLRIKFDEMLIGSFLFLGWSNLAWVSFINIATPRYLMPNFIFFALPVLLFICCRIRNFFKHKQVV